MSVCWYFLPFLEAFDGAQQDFTSQIYDVSILTKVISSNEWVRFASLQSQVKVKFASMYFRVGTTGSLGPWIRNIGAVHKRRRTFLGGEGCLKLRYVTIWPPQGSWKIRRRKFLALENMKSLKIVFFSEIVPKFCSSNSVNWQ